LTRASGRPISISHTLNNRPQSEADGTAAVDPYAERPGALKAVARGLDEPISRLVPDHRLVSEHFVGQCKTAWPPVGARAQRPTGPHLHRMPLPDLPSARGLDRPIMALTGRAIMALSASIAIGKSPSRCASHTGPSASRPASLRRFLRPCSGHLDPSGMIFPHTTWRLDACLTKCP
jgi:hypothetical protein